MAYVTRTVDINIDLGDFSDGEILAEAEDRGLQDDHYSDEMSLDDFDDDELEDELKKRKRRGLTTAMEDAILNWQRGNIQESLHQIEIAYPCLYGITKLRKE
tara:strand:- start:22207 stop:22512 length:306 start_codon:yes stop_codon:yes gene_type:complete